MAKKYIVSKPSYKDAKKKKETVKKKESLSIRQKNTLKKHSKHHTKNHMDTMKASMKGGMNFTEAHEKAMKTVGV